MSEWLECKDKDDLEVDGEYLNVWFESDDFGNRYIQIPVDFIIEKLGKID